MSHEIRADYSQSLLFPPSLEDLLPADHPARFIREFVDSLDLGQMGFKLPQTTEGRPCYAADLMLKVWIYGFLEQIRSTRKLERTCRQHVALMWLTGMHYPDHNALWRFWRDNHAALKEVFRKTVQVALKMGLVDMTLLAVDGTKIASQSSTRGVWNKKRLQERLARLDRELREMMRAVEEAEKLESGEYALPEPLQRTATLKEEVRCKLEELEKEQRESMHPGEREAKIVKTQDGKRLGYNAQAATDGKAGIIVAAEVTTDPNDKFQLVPMIEAAQEMTGKVSGETLADSGYFSGEQLAAAEAKSLPVTVSLNELESAEEKAGVYGSAHFKYDSEKDVCICPQGKELPFKSTKKEKSKRYTVRTFKCASYQQCPVRGQCCKGKGARQVSINPYHEQILRQKEKHRDEARRALLRRRMSLAEPVFAWIKHLLGFRRWTVRGLRKVQHQWSFACAVVNLSKIMRRWAEGGARLA